MKLFPKLNKSEYTKNSMILMAGTAFNMILQAVSVIWIGEIYSSEYWGIFEYFSISYSILLIIATGRYELAIMLPKDDNDGYLLAMLSAFMSFAFSIIIAIVLGVFYFVFNINLEWLVFLPLVLIVLGIYYSCNYWLNRQKKYKQLALNRVIQGILYVVFNIGYSFVLPDKKYGLILGYITAQAIVAIILLIYMIIDYKKFDIKFNIHRIKELAYEYKKFPLISTPAGVINTFALRLPAILLGVFIDAPYDKYVVGQYSMMSKILTAPITVISEAIRDVFRQRASKDYSQYGECRKCFKSTFRTLSLVAVVPFIIIMFGARPMLNFLFDGQVWNMAGFFIMIMAPSYYVTFIVNPMTFMTYIAKKQSFDIKWQMLFTISSFAAIFIGYFFTKNPYIMLGLFGVQQAAMYLIYFSYANKLSKGKLNQQEIHN